jgi:hypothetical protein
LTTAAQTKIGIILQYLNTGPLDCSTLPTYGSSPAPQYVMLNPGK